MNNKAMYNLGYGLYVLTGAKNGSDSGCIINTAVQVTTTPNRITIAVNKQNFTHDLIAGTGVFNVSLLTEKAPFSLFKHFGFQSGRDVNKFDGWSDVKRSENGILYLSKYTNAYISGKVITATDLGTHTLFLADVTDCDVLSAEPSMTYAYYHKNVKENTKTEVKKGWRCSICGYVYEGEELPDDFVCPICKHGAADFEKII